MAPTPKSTSRTFRAVQALRLIGQGLQQLAEALEPEEAGKGNASGTTEAEAARLGRIRETLAAHAAGVTRALFDLRNPPPQRVERRGPTVVQAVDRLVPRRRP